MVGQKASRAAPIPGPTVEQESLGAGSLGGHGGSRDSGGHGGTCSEATAPAPGETGEKGRRLLILLGLLFCHDPHTRRNEEMQENTSN